MSTQKLLGLPPISQNLKSIVPFLQRAEELKDKEPIVSYWCAYYAAQAGINLKSRDTASRDVLFTLLGTLEHMKNAIGNVDAIEIESASAAYVENFALKVFNSADSEDRRGAATRATAKKFLAASNFLEVLKTFPKNEVADSNEEKIRYAKWKAAEIAKAFREGRKPTPGPAGQEPDIQPEEQSSHILRTTPPPQLEYNGISRVNQNNSHLFSGKGEATPGSWSTAATPGTTTHDLDTTASFAPGTQYNLQNGHVRSGSGSSTHSSAGVVPRKTKKAWVSDEVEGKITPSSSPPHASALKASRSSGTPEGKKSVHFTPITETPPSPTVSSKPSSPTYQGPHSIYASHGDNGTPSPSQLPPTGISPPKNHHSISPTVPFYSPPVPPPPPQVNNLSLKYPTAILPSQSPPAIYAPPPPPPPLPVPVPVTPSISMELTPSLIAKTQKHCRFAISALDYEDAETAKKELRAALALLGGL